MERGGLYIIHAEKLRGRGEKRRDRYTGFSRNEKRKESRTRMTGRGEGIKQGSVIFA